MAARITVLVDNEAGGGLRASWGLSMLVEAGGLRVLFDADTDPEVLEHNARVLGVELSGLDFAVLSHPHSDHYGGFAYVASVAPGTRVYIPRGSGRVASLLRRLGLTPLEVSEAAVLEGPFASTGVLEGVYRGRGIPEHALVVDLGGGRAAVLVGCSHPGVDRLVGAVVEALGLKPVFVIGGFHSPPPEALDRLAELVEGRICPIHCSGEEAKRYIRENYPDAYCEARAGSVFEL